MMMIKTVVGLICLLVIALGPQKALSLADVREQEGSQSLEIPHIKRSASIIQPKLAKGGCTPTSTPISKICPYGEGYSSTSPTGCAICPAGTYAYPNGFTGSEVCLPCPKGTYNPTEGSFTCLPCVKGTVATSTGKKICTKCPSRTYYVNSTKCSKIIV